MHRTANHHGYVNALFSQIERDLRARIAAQPKPSMRLPW